MRGARLRHVGRDLLLHARHDRGGLRGVPGRLADLLDLRVRGVQRGDSGSISTGMPSLVIPETRPPEFCEATTRLGLYLAIASMLGVRPDRPVFGTPAG